MLYGKSYKTEAVVLKKIKLGEADRILTLLTPESGKIQAVAKGVRKPKSKMAGHLELLTHSLITLNRGRNLDTITGCQTIEGFLPLKNDLTLMSHALYITELTDQFTIGQEVSRDVFQLLLNAYKYLCDLRNKEIILRYFEMQLLNLTGFSPELQNCVNCRRKLEPVTNYFSSEAGGILCPDCTTGRAVSYPVTVNALKILRLLQNADILFLVKIKIDTELYRELEEISRRYVKYILEKELKSTEWMDNLKSNQAFQ